jgi:hypothetical protein
VKRWSSIWTSLVRKSRADGQPPPRAAAVLVPLVRAAASANMDRVVTQLQQQQQQNKPRRALQFDDLGLSAAVGISRGWRDCAARVARGRGGPALRALLAR